MNNHMRKKPVQAKKRFKKEPLNPNSNGERYLFIIAKIVSAAARPQNPAMSTTGKTA